MKKINLFFILECVIIVLLLAILGILLKDSSKNKAKDMVLSETEFIYENSSEGVPGEGAQVPLSEMKDHINQETEGVNETIGESSEEPYISNIDTKQQFMEGKKIVVFGDSIWNDARGKDGISEHIQQKTGATVYNCAVGGSTAALVGGENTMENWDSNSFNGMIYAARRLVSIDKVLPDLEANAVIRQVNLEEMDYVIVAYGLNDFFCDVSIYPQTYYEITNYVGALRNGIGKLQENYPGLQIIVVSPTYTKMFEGEKQFEIGDYVEAARGVAKEFNVQFLDMFHVLGEDEESRVNHLLDGVHLTARGREIYADAVIRFLENLEK